MEGTRYQRLINVIDNVPQDLNGQDLERLAAEIGAEWLASSLQSTAVAASVLLLNSGDEKNGREIIRDSMRWIREASSESSVRGEDWKLVEAIQMLAAIKRLSGIAPVLPDWSALCRPVD